jgi:PGF-CTERM protein
MTERSVSRRTALGAMGAAAVGLLGVPTAGAQEAGDVTVALDPSEVTLTPGETTTVDIVVRGATGGISSYEQNRVTLSSDVATFVAVKHEGDGLSDHRISEDGTRVSLMAALLDNKRAPASEIAIAEATIRGEEVGSATLGVDGGKIFSRDIKSYATTGQPGTLTVEQRPPLRAALDWAPEEPTTGEQVTFDATSSAGRVAEYRWDFDGDGTGDATTDGPTTTHAYSEAGSKTVRLEIADTDGRTDEFSAELAVVDSGPEAALTWEPTAPEAGEAVTLDATGSAGDVVEYRWDFDGDGTIDATTVEPTTTTTYETAGSRTVRVTVVESDGQTASDDGELSVTEPSDGDDSNGNDNSDDSSDDNSDDNTNDDSNGGDDSDSDDSDSSESNTDGNDGDSSESDESDGSGDNGGNSTDGDETSETNDEDDDSTDDKTDGNDERDTDSENSEADGDVNTSDDANETGDADSGDGFGPGFTPGGALAGLGGAAYLLKRRLGGDDSAE